MKKILFLCCFLLAICTPVQAEIIEATSSTHPIYNGDDYFYDNISGLTWMNLYTYPAYSFNELEAELVGTNFNIATVSQVQALIESSKDQSFSEKAALMGSVYRQDQYVIWGICDDPDSTLMEAEAIQYEDAAEFVVWIGYIDPTGGNSNLGAFIVLDEDAPPPEDIDDDGYTKNEGDCDDTDASVYPGAAEICGDSIDQDCDGSDKTCPEATQDIIDDVVEMVDLGNLNERYDGRLLSDLNDAINHINHGNIRQAIRKLNDFIDKINKLIKRGKMDPAEGNELIAAAQDIIDQLLAP